VNIGILLYHEVNELDLISPFAVLSSATKFLSEEAHVFTLAKSRNSVQTLNGMTITPLYAFASAPDLDVLIVPGGTGVDKALRDKAIASYLPSALAQAKTYAAISSGAILLGHYGALRGKTVTIHPDLKERLESYEVMHISAKTVVFDENVWTCNGSIAGLELAFELCKHLFGDGVTTRVAELYNAQTRQGQLF